MEKSDHYNSCNAPLQKLSANSTSSGGRRGGGHAGALEPAFQWLEKLISL